MLSCSCCPNFIFFPLPILFKQLLQLYYADLQACRAHELGRQDVFSQVLTALISWHVRVEKLPVELHFSIFFLAFLFIFFFFPEKYPQ